MLGRLPRPGGGPLPGPGRRGKGARRWCKVEAWRTTSTNPRATLHTATSMAPPVAQKGDPSTACLVVIYGAELGKRIALGGGGGRVRPLDADGHPPRRRRGEPAPRPLRLDGLVLRRRRSRDRPTGRSSTTPRCASGRCSDGDQVKIGHTIFKFICGRQHRAQLPRRDLPADDVRRAHPDPQQALLRDVDRARGLAQPPLPPPALAAALRHRPLQEHQRPVRPPRRRRRAPPARGAGERQHPPGGHRWPASAARSSRSSCPRSRWTRPLGGREAARPHREHALPLRGRDHPHHRELRRGRARGDAAHGAHRALPERRRAALRGQARRAQPRGELRR